MSEPHVYACMPCYGNPHRESAKQFWARSMDPDGPYKNKPRIMDDKGSSLLGNAFDVHWATALNMQQAGYSIDRFAMLHSDVVPGDWWLDQLLHDLDETGADVVSAVVAIKDLNGLTSTAIDDPEDPWDVLRRLTASEVMKLPEIFSAADCGYPDHLLLVNTGCWICDFTKPWRHARNPDGSLAVNFNIRNAILPLASGSYATKAAPEDWEFSRKVGRLGGKVLATRRVATSHMGEFPYPSRGYWGKQEMDEVFANKAPRPVGEEIPSVEGWLSPAEGRLLARYAAGKDVLEIGSYCGLSTVWLGRTARSVYCIDTFDGRGTPKPRNTYWEFLANLERYQLLDKTIAYRGESRQALPGADRRFDLAFVDGAHNSEDLAIDTAVALRTLRPDGLLAFHDYQGAPKDAAVTTFVDALIEEGCRIVERVDTLVILRMCHLTYQENGHGRTPAENTRSLQTIVS
jgi:predicted O-methyltransferase YrrM